ncbi:CPBP family intramembrane metalloprotease [Bacteroidales bacterium OttesenSCG-928-M11]|nr:CPBP family intramembrane metalloprotease [Bacteroidales bacterium OttesenSCG-928-M11]
MILESLRNSSKTLLEAQQAKLKTHPLLTLLYVILIFIVGSIIMAIPYFIIMLLSGGISFEDGLKLNSSNNFWIQNLLLIVIIFSYIGYCKWIEGRSIRSLGFSRKGITRQYIQGAVLGFGMISISLGLCFATGAMEYQGISESISWGIIFLFLLGFMVQGMSEEVMLRSYTMVSLSNRMHIVWAILISSILFGLLHCFNNSFSWVAMLNLVLYGIFASLYFLSTDNIWAVGAQHSIWNWAQGNVYGINVSGIEVNDTISRFTPVEGKDFISGGGFGLEGGIAVTIVLVFGIIYLLYNIKNKSVA